MKTAAARLGILTILFSAHLFSQWVQTSGPEGGYVWAIAEDDEYLYAGTFATVFRMSKGDSVWTPLYKPNNQVVSACCLAVCDSILVAGTDGDAVHRSTDHGVTWQRWNSGFEGTPTTFSLLSYKDELYAGTNHGVYLSKDQGANWIPVNRGQDRLLVLCLAVKDSILFAGTLGGGVYRSNPYRTQWAPVNNGLTGTTVWSLVVIDSTIFAGTWGGEGVYRSTDNGDTWTVASTGLPNPGVNALENLGGYLFAGTFGGLSVSTDQGESWMRFAYGPESVINKLHASGTDLYAGTFDGVCLSKDWGITWNPLRRGFIGTGVSALVQSGGTLFAGTGDLYRSVDDGVNWERTSLPATDVTSLTVRDSTMFAGTSHGVIRSTDGGEHWSSPTPGLGGERVIALFAMGVDTESTHLFAGTEGHGLYRSTDEGQTWEAVNSGIEDTTVWCFAARDSNVFAGAAGGVYLSTNGGDSWSSTSRGVIDAPVRGLAVIGETVVAGTEGQGVFLSTDCGTQWRQANNGLSDLNVLCLVARGSKMFAGTWFADVYLSEDSGSTWTRVDEGYKKVPILALEMTETDLYIGSRGGGVWRRPLSEMRAQAIAPSDDVPTRFDLGQNYPNPFNPSTTIEYELPTQSHVTLRVFNMLGQEVAVLVDELQLAGYKSLEFKTQGLPSGVYLYRLTAGDFVATKKLVLLK